MSIGGWGDSELIHEAVKYAYDAGVLLVAAAGNAGTNMKSYPAGYDEVISVAATDEYDDKAQFSNWGDWIELAAPGVNIYSTVPGGYSSMSGTSMACPHVAGVAALAWSQYPNSTRDWVRMWLRYCADDLGAEGFDVLYGYGRVNARKAVQLSPPTHELIACSWTTPPYVKPGTSAMVNATLLNFGNDETGVSLQLLANDTVVDSAMIGFLPGGNSVEVTLTWIPVLEGLYNLTFYVVPMPGEVNLENNVLSRSLFVGFAVKAVVLHSAGNVYSDIITSWQTLSGEWYLFGDSMVSIDYTTLNKEEITYADIAATEADVLIISCAFDPYAGWQFSDSEIEAIERYVYEGHGLIATAGTFYEEVPNNNKLASLFGMHETIRWDSTGTDLLHLLNTTHPLFVRVPNPLVFPQVGTALPNDGRWDSTELVSGEYLGLGHYQESAIVTFRGLVYISPWLEAIPPYYQHHLQLLYNAIMWSRYQKPQHELVVSLNVPPSLNPGESTLLNATVSNVGLSNETDVELRLFINGALVDDVTMPQLLVDSSYSLSYPWTPTVQGVYNITAYAPPIAGEEFTENNIVGNTVLVLLIAVRKVLVYSDDYFVAPSSRYVIIALNELGINFTYYSNDPLGFGSALVSQSWDMVIVDHCNYYAIGNYWTELDDYVREGGLLVLGTFDIDGSNSEPTNLWDTLGVSWVSDMSYLEPVYRWVTSHDIFTFPNSVGDLTSYSNLGYNDRGDHVAATTGTAIAGFTSSPAADSASIVVGNVYQTVLFSFRVDEFRYDQDGDGKLDAIELWQNAIVYAAKGFEHDLAVSLYAPTFLEPGDSVVLNATVRNRGSSNETNLTLELIIDGTIVDSQLVPELLSGASHTIGFLWTPVEGTYNVTAYAQPVSSEEHTTNNVATKIVNVKPIRYILFDQTHGTDNNYSYSTWLTSLTERGYVVETNYAYPITPMTLDTYDVLIIPQATYPYTGDELTTIQDFVFSGGGLLVIGDDYPSLFSDLTRFADILWTSGGMSGITTDIVPHPVTAGVSSVYLSAPICYISVSGAAQGLVRDPAGNIMLAVSEQGGKVLGFADEDSLRDYSIGQADNLRLANNMMDWLSTSIPVEHDLVVSLEAPAILEAGTSVMLNATVRNRGLNSETNVELQLLINRTEVNSVVIPELPVGTFYTLSYNLSSPDLGKKFNVTAYAIPVPGETVTSNNVVMRIVTVPFYVRTYSVPQWVGGGTPMDWHADDNTWYYILPFSFPFYGVFYDSIYISSNGLITFNWPDTSYGNGISELAGKLAIAPAWDDWTTYDPFDIYIWENSTQIGIRWYARHLGSGNLADFEVILRGSDGVIQFNYGYNNGLVSATVGISNGINEVLAEDVTDLNYASTIFFTPPPASPRGPDVAVSLEAPAFLDPGESVLLNATIRNCGPNNETNVELQLLVNGTVVRVTIVPQLVTGTSFASAYLWTPTIEGTYNITSYSPPRYNETITENNVARKMVLVGRPSGTHVYVSPLFVKTTVGTVFTVDVKVAYIEDLYGYEFVLYYNRTVLECRNITLPPDHFLKPQDPTLLLIVKFEFNNQYNATHGRIFVAMALLNPEMPKSGSGILVTLNFKGISLGESSLDLADTMFANSNAQLITHIALDGYVEVATPAISRDVALTNVTQYSEEAYEGWTVSISVVAANLGNVPETFNVTLYYDNQPIGTQMVTNLNVGEEITLVFNWNTSGVELYVNHTIWAQASTVPAETNTSNNIMTDGSVKVKLLGDVNGDKRINIADIVRVAVAFGARPLDPRWDLQADITANGIIDIVDIVTIALHLNESSP
jgi:subtilase family serine protease